MAVFQKKLLNNRVALIENLRLFAIVTCSRLKELDSRVLMGKVVLFKVRFKVQPTLMDVIEIAGKIPEILNRPEQALGEGIVVGDTSSGVGVNHLGVVYKFDHFL